MIFPIKFALGLTILALPIAEIALLIKAGATFGFWPVFSWIIATAILGAVVIQRSGLSIFSRIFAHIEAGGSGFEPMLDQLLTVTGGVLLIFPGLLGDAVGALLLLPPVRWALRRGLASCSQSRLTRAQPAPSRVGGGKRKITILFHVGRTAAMSIPHTRVGRSEGGGRAPSRRLSKVNTSGSTTNLKDTDACASTMTLAIAPRWRA